MREWLTDPAAPEAAKRQAEALPRMAVSVAGQVSHAWAHGSSVMVRPGAGQPVEVSSGGWSESTAAKGELKGRLAVVDAWGVPLAMWPWLGVFIVSVHAPATTNSLGETSAGPFGET